MAAKSKAASKAPTAQPAAGSKLTPARRAALELTRELREREAFARELIDSRRGS